MELSEIDAPLSAVLAATHMHCLVTMFIHYSYFLDTRFHINAECSEWLKAAPNHSMFERL